MTSFKKRLLLILIGVVLINFLLIGFSFNILIGQYIKSQAEKELFTSRYSVQGVASQSTLDVTVTVPAPPGAYSKNALNGKVTPAIPGESSGNALNGKVTPTIPGASSENALNGTVKTVIPTQQVPLNEDVSIISRAVPITDSVISTDCIIFDRNNEVMFPLQGYETNDVKNSVEYLSNYLKANREEFKKAALVKTRAVNKTYFASLISIGTINGFYEVLLYTDITPVQNFANMINYVLILILIISGLITVLVGIRMCGGLNRAIKSLCNYAEQIGHGKFKEQQQHYSFAEFNQLSQSMSDMSQQLEANNNQKQMFFQNVSHELRTPLMSIQGYAEGIQQEVFENHVEAADVIVMESEKMLSLVNELLYISRMDSGLQKLNMNMLDAKDLLTACIDSVKIIAQRDGKLISSNFPASPVLIEADEEQLTNAILNIFINGIRHAKNCVVVSCRVVGKEVRIEIIDDGNGIAQKDVPHIFERFYMGENGKSGLGLSITKEIIEKHNGRIIAENIDTGAKFTVYLNLTNNV